MKELEVFKTTEEEWYPNFSKNFVSVSYGSFLQEDHYDWEYKFRVSVWGDDDHGLEKWYSGDNGNIAWNDFISIISQKNVTHDFCKTKGLKPA